MAKTPCTFTFTSNSPASVDLHLDSSILVFANSRRPYIDVKEGLEDLTQMVEIQEESPFILHPGEFVLGSTLENIELPDDLVARLEGKSSLGRIGLVIHSTAGFVDPGWKGHLTLELSNLVGGLLHGDDLGMADGLAALLDRLARIEGAGWIRFLYVYPNRVTQKLLDTMAAPGTLHHPKVPGAVSQPAIRKRRSTLPSR